MRNRRISILFLGLLLSPAAARGDDLKTLRDLGAAAWNLFAQRQIDDGRRQFDDFLEKVSTSTTALRDTQIEIIVGVLGCAMPEHRKIGHDMLDHVLATGKGISEIRATLSSIRDSCTGDEKVETFPANTWKLVVASASSGIGVSGKGGSPVSKPVGSVAISHVDLAEFEKRLQETADPGTALGATLKRFGHAGTVTDHFIVAVENGDSGRAQGIAKCLDAYGADLTSEFKMAYPSHLITVYNAAWEDSVYQIAERLHGLQLPSGTIAYSVYADLSMTGAGDTHSCGSLGHELTHLMIKDNFGDAPPWLEEGLASAVALAVAGKDRFAFHDGWRDTVLRDKWSMRPSVAQLLQFTWDDFSASHGGDLNRAAAIQAMASVFVRYLAVRNKLEDVYFAVRDQGLMTDLQPHSTVQQILETRLGLSLAELDKEFVAWFDKQRSVHSGQESNLNITPRTCLPGEQPNPMAQEAPCKPAVLNQATPPPK